MLSLRQRNKKSKDNHGRGSSGEKKQQNERRRGAIRMVLLRTVGLFKVCKKPRKSVSEFLMFRSCTTKKDGQIAQPSSFRNPQ